MLGRIALILSVLFYNAVGAESQEPPVEQMGFNVVGLSFVAIQVRDEAAAADWYSAVLGLAEVNRREASDGRYSIRLLSAQGLSVELIRSSAVAVRPVGSPLGLFKAGFYVDDIEAALVWFRAQGVDTDQAIFTDEALRARSFVFRDLEGNRLQVFQGCGTACDELPGQGSPPLSPRFSLPT